MIAGRGLRLIPSDVRSELRGGDGSELTVEICNSLPELGFTFLLQRIDLCVAGRMACIGTIEPPPFAILQDDGHGSGPKIGFAVLRLLGRVPNDSHLSVGEMKGRLAILPTECGFPRVPSEAPFEYVERALGELETSAESAHRLTDLFEWAKFSQHEPGPEMRDDAIDALIAVRDELKRPAEAVVA